MRTIALILFFFVLITMIRHSIFKYGLELNNYFYMMDLLPCFFLLNIKIFSPVKSACDSLKSVLTTPLVQLFFFFFLYMWDASSPESKQHKIKQHIILSSAYLEQSPRQMEPRSSSFFLFFCNLSICPMLFLKHTSS